MILRLVTFEGANPRKDKSVTIRLSTLEQTGSQAAELFDLINKVCVVAIKPDSESYLKDELEALDEIEVDILDNHKTPSKRLRDVLWVYCKQELGEKPSDEQWKEFYKTKYEQLIQHFKDKLTD